MNTGINNNDIIRVATIVGVVLETFQLLTIKSLIPRHVARHNRIPAIGKTKIEYIDPRILYADIFQILVDNAQKLAVILLINGVL